MKINIRKLKHHPFNSEVYKLSDIDSLQESINNIGLLEPLIINKKNEVLSGNRRLEALKNLKHQKVKVIVKELKDKDEPLHIISHNSQRIKTSREILNEISVLSKYYKNNQGFRSDLTSVDINRGGSRKKISEKLGISGDKVYKLIYINSVSPKLIDLIDNGNLSINQSYLEAKKKENYNQIHKNFELNNKLQTVKKSSFILYNKSSEDMLELKDNSINMILTSPPYFSQRDYGSKGQIGLESTIDNYIKNMMRVFDECYRVLSNQGSCWVVIGDSYIDGSLGNIPHRFAIEMVKKKWIQRNTIIWNKTNPKPESVKTRLGTSNEFIFFFTKKRQDYYFDVDSIRIPYKESENIDPKTPRHHSISGDFQRHSPIFQNNLGKVPLDFFQGSKYSGNRSKKIGLKGVEHISVYPEYICYLPIKSGSKINDTILDPFCGSGTTGSVALELKRKFIGYEINPNFLELSKIRLNKKLRDIN